MPSLLNFIEARKFETVLKEKVDSQVCVTELLRCRNGAGRPFFAYIRLKPSEYMDYKIKLERGEGVNPNDYEIVEYGWGESPPQHLMDMMEEKFGVDHEFEKHAKQQRKETARKEAV